MKSTEILIVAILLVASKTAHGFFFSKPTSTTKEQNLPKLERHLIGVAPYEYSKYSADVFVCDGDKILGRDELNDNFCDCLDGTDEPGTSSCSNAVFNCVNKGYRMIKLPSSRVGDGICDCCDGSDEFGQCSDVCSVAASKEREMLEKLTSGYKVGKRTREESIVEITQELQQKGNLAVSLIKEIEQYSQELEQLEQKETEEVEQIAHLLSKSEAETHTSAKELLGVDAMDEQTLGSFLQSLFEVASLSEVDVAQALNGGAHSTAADVSDEEDGYSDSRHPPSAVGDGNGDEYEDSYAEDHASAHQSERGYEQIDDPDEGVQENIAADAADGTEASPAPLCPLSFSGEQVDPRLALLCKEFAEQPLLDRSRDFLLKLAEKNKLYNQLQLLVGYYRIQGSFAGASEFVASQRELEVQADVGESCPALFAAEPEALCSVGHRLEQIFDQHDATVRGVQRPAGDAVREGQTHLRTRRQALKEAETDASDLQTFAGRLEYRALKGQCFDVVDAKFTYKFCPLDDISQVGDFQRQCM